MLTDLQEIQVRCGSRTEHQDGAGKDRGMAVKSGGKAGLNLGKRGLLGKLRKKTKNQELVKPITFIRD